jgi:hypothetical protein
MREALVLQLEKLSYYQHLSLSGGRERPIFACRSIDIRGSRFHVLSRIQDAGLDFTGRTNFIAHHLAFTPEEIRQFPSPPRILRDWPGWMKSWTKEPQLLENEEWAGLTAIAGKSCLPARTWKKVTGDAVNGYGLLDTRAAAVFRADDLTDEVILELFAESLELLEVRDARKDFRATAWQYTFITSMQEQDNPADFRWRCIHADNPAASRFTPPDCRPLAALRASKWSGEEVALARNGRQPPRFIIEPQNLRMTEGQSASLISQAEGVPAPAYQWFSVDRDNKGQILTGETNPELPLKNPPLGVSRYIVRATNSTGEATSQVATLNFEQKPRIATITRHGERDSTFAAHQKSEDQIERNRLQLQAKQAEEQYEKRQRRNKLLGVFLVLACLVAAGATAWSYSQKWKKRNNSNTQLSTTNAPPPPQGIAATPPAVPPASGGNTSMSPTEASNSTPSSRAMSLDMPKPLDPPWSSSVFGGVQNSPVKAYPNAHWEKDKLCVTGIGKQIYETTDECFFVHQTVSNLKELTVHLYLPVIGVSSSRLGGIMLRESEAADSPFVFIGVCGSTVWFRYRPAKGAACSNLGNQSFKGEEIYLKLSQAGTEVTGWFSTNSIFTKPIVGPAIMPISGTNCLIGLVVCSGSSDKLATAKFDQIKIDPSESH